MKQEIEFIKLNPTQNMTILIKTSYPFEKHSYIASRVMSYDSVYAEQVGFIEKPVNAEAAAHLQMGGNEFCGNACMALAAFIASEKGLRQNDSTDVLLESSGTEQLVICQVQKKSEVYYCQVNMPIPKKVDLKIVHFENEELNIITVNYPDFIHIVIEVDEFNNRMRKKAENLARLIGATSGTNLIGVLLYKSKSEELAPLMYVPHLDSLIWERGCGSGTASIGAYLAWRNKGEVAVKIRQPGGIITVNAACHEGELTSLNIEGSVSIVAQGKAFIDC
ncbi:diaminopimelate epimerase [Planococcus antarcticus DSM 14505]|uniref:Diaminopimelate epimerase n=1 Tax=Planococcus antarcticus DSM 14505 TaxID=1185653 RepID=A0ABM6D9Y3_9BACL|nr:diaminopimelate epimerase [Planococcus antarcticus]ANU12244.1 diaminopimelate epimerase [Planococcus antarcticus DSM 14505]